jgi:CheY-like chemotaxis protein
VEQAVTSRESEPVQLIDDATPAATSGTETVLLVEDEEAVRDLTCEILEMHGYRVLSASNGHDAIHAYDRYDARIDLLLTDVVMPVMGGRELAQKLTQRQADLKVLYASGYADDTVFHEGKLEPSAAFLGKPFTPADLATKVREVLGSATDDSSSTTRQP